MKNFSVQYLLSNVEQKKTAPLGETPSIMASSPKDIDPSTGPLTTDLGKCHMYLEDYILIWYIFLLQRTINDRPFHRHSTNRRMLMKMRRKTTTTSTGKHRRELLWTVELHLKIVKIRSIFNKNMFIIMNHPNDANGVYFLPNNRRLNLNDDFVSNGIFLVNGWIHLYKDNHRVNHSFSSRTWTFSKCYQSLGNSS